MTHEDFETIAALDAVGAASAEESAELRRHAGECIPCRKAVQEYGEAVTLLVRDLDAVPPPAEVRSRVMDTVQTADNTTASTPAPQPRLTWLLAAAAALFAILGLWQASQVRRLSEENDRLFKQRLALTQQADTLSTELEALAAHDTRQIALTGQVIAPSASAKVFLEPSRKRAVVFFHNLPLNGKDKSYQLWIIRADQPQPVSAGVFDARKNGRASISIENLPISTEIKGLAVTLEPRGGAKQPTNTDFIVSGNIS